jgi:hypothetical protein
MPEISVQADGLLQFPLPTAWLGFGWIDDDQFRNGETGKVLDASQSEVRESARIAHHAVTQQLSWGVLQSRHEILRYAIGMAILGVTEYTPSNSSE